MHFFHRIDLYLSIWVRLVSDILNDWLVRLMLGSLLDNTSFDFVCLKEEYDGLTI